MAPLVYPLNVLRLQEKEPRYAYLSEAKASYSQRILSEVEQRVRTVSYLPYPGLPKLKANIYFGSVKRQTRQKYRLIFVFIDLLHHISICACSYKTCFDSRYFFMSRSHLVPHRGKYWNKNKKRCAQNCTDYSPNWKFLSCCNLLALYWKPLAIFWVSFRFYSSFVTVHKHILFFSMFVCRSFSSDRNFRAMVL